jgi:hypothetical protein
MAGMVKSGIVVLGALSGRGNVNRTAPRASRHNAGAVLGYCKREARD